MLKTLSADFQEAGHTTTVTVDSRIQEFQPFLKADQIQAIPANGDYLPTIKRIADRVDATCIIAPESKGTLESLAEELEGDALLLNSPSQTIAKTCNKDSLLKIARGIGLATPRSLTLSVGEDDSDTAQRIAEEIGFPAIIKPLNDAGMTGLSLAKDVMDVPSAIRKVCQESEYNRFIAQEFVEGIPASVSLISTGKKAIGLSLNKQKITLYSKGESSTYEGGEVPLENPLRIEALGAAKKLVETYEHLKGYIGVDMILTEKEPVLIEVNPRLTTSYIGLREVGKFNPASAILDAAIRCKLPGNEQTDGYACFSKVKTPVFSRQALRRAFKLKGLVAPPFTAPDQASALSIICSKGPTLEEANLQLEKSKAELLSFSQNKVE